MSLLNDLAEKRLVKSKHFPLAFPNQNRRVQIVPTFGNNLEGAINWAETPGSGFCPHYIIGLDGKCVQLLRLDSEQNVGGVLGSIGIALVNHGNLIATSGGFRSRFSGLPIAEDAVIIPGETDQIAWQMATPAQIQCLVQLLAALRDKFGFMPVHSDDLGLAIPKTELLTGDCGPAARVEWHKKYENRPTLMSSVAAASSAVASSGIAAGFVS
jgi:N-acetyl-anhydromuramyl-L-alanine amidase AmpD